MILGLGNMIVLAALFPLLMWNGTYEFLSACPGYSVSISFILLLQSYNSQKSSGKGKHILLQRSFCIDLRSCSGGNLQQNKYLFPYETPGMGAQSCHTGNADLQGMENDITSVGGMGMELLINRVSKQFRNKIAVDNISLNLTPVCTGFWEPTEPEKPL